MSQDLAVGFIANRGQDGGRPWSLVTLLGSFLSEAERRFGERNKDWTILGIELSDGCPHVWFPQSGERRVVVSIGSAEARSLPLLIFHLAQEVIHLLEPNGGGAASRFEEGVATLFGREIAAGCNIPFPISDMAYLTAEADVLALGHDTDAIVRAVRAHHGSLSAITPRGLSDAVAGCDPLLAERLCQTFTNVA